MSLAALAPLGLLGLLALIVPIVVHLIRRSEEQLTMFAALRWLQAQMRPRRRLRIERPWLLVLRLLLVACVALLLAQLIVRGWTPAPQSWVLVAPGIEEGSARQQVVAPDAQWHWLAPGFPSVETGPAPRGDVAVASLLREFDATQPANISTTVLVPRQIGGLDGARIQLQRAVDWRPLDAPAPPVATVAPSKPVGVTVRYDATPPASAAYLQAAVAAWNVSEPGRYRWDAQAKDAVLGQDARWLIWLGGKPSAAVESWVGQGGTLLLDNQGETTEPVVWRDSQGDAMLRASKLGQGRILKLNVPLQPATLPLLLDAGFPDQLLRWLEGPAAPPDRADAEVVKPTIVAEDAPTPETDVQRGLILAAAFLFLLERMLAHTPRTSRAPRMGSA